MARSKAQLVRDASGSLVQRNVKFTAAEEAARDVEEDAWRTAAPTRARDAKIDAEVAATLSAEKMQRRMDAQATLIARGEIT